MKVKDCLLPLSILMLSACSPATSKNTAPLEPAAAAPREHASPEVDTSLLGSGLEKLGQMTFACPKAGLNAAAEAAAKAPTQGTYQFSYFRIVNDSHDSNYEVHFKSNYFGEPELKYCVTVYCQQGWDPEKSNPTVRLMSDGSQPSGATAASAAHSTDCAEPQTPLKRRSKR